MPLLEAATRWYSDRYGLQLDAKEEALMLIGSQEGLGGVVKADMCVGSDHRMNR